MLYHNLMSKLHVNMIDCDTIENTESNARAKKSSQQSSERRSCSNCGTFSTSTWRNLGDQIVCNACKCFYRKHGKNRPVHMRKDTIIKRQSKSRKLTITNYDSLLAKNDKMFDNDPTNAIDMEKVYLMLEGLKNI